MQLVSIESKEENDAIINGMSIKKKLLLNCPFLYLYLPVEAFNLTTSFWTAATDLGHQGNFYWDSTGDFLAVHSDWGVGEPNNNDGSEHCVLLVNGPLSDGKFHWGDEPCYLRNRYVCENNLTSFNNY
jgi:Lectin C-type domain